MMEVAAWRAHNDAYLGTALRWLRARFATFGEPQAAGAEDARDLEGALRAAEASEPPPALVLLGAAFDLTPFERKLLLLAVAAALDTRVPELCARAQGDDAKPYPTFGLALALFDDPEWEAVSAARPLRYWQLVDVAVTPAVPVTAAALQADERIVHFVKGLNTIDARLLSLVQPVPRSAIPPVPSHAAIAEAIAEQQRERGVTLVQLAGSRRESKLTVASAAADRMGLLLYTLSSDALAQPPTDVDGFVRLWGRESRLLPLALYLDLHDPPPTPQQLGILRRLAASGTQRGAGPVFLSLREPCRDLAADSLLFEIRTPQIAEQRALWARGLADEAGDLPDRLSAQFDFDTAEIAHILSLHAAQSTSHPARSTAHGAPGTSHEPRRTNHVARSTKHIARSTEHVARDTCHPLWSTCVSLSRPRLNAVAQRIEPRATWDDIVLTAETRRLLEEIALQVRNRHRVYDAWGWRARLGRGLGVTALFAGESGTGKTMAAEVVANDLGLDLYRVDLSVVVSKYIGETEKNLREVFDAAEQGGAVLLFDEADALFGKRSEVKDSHDRYANMEVSYLLQRLECYDGVAILATNMKSHLDTAFVRRLRFIVPFGFPGAAERKEIWERAFTPETPVNGVDFERLARLNLNGAAIHSIALNAAFLAAARNTRVDMPLLREAARAELRKRERHTGEADAL